jgi:WhiB family redox-sensing transcriptional regulator
MARPALSVVPEPDVELWPLTSLIGDSDWAARAVCTGSDPDALFVTGAAQRNAAKLCQACPVRLECLADALDNQIEYGVWGGMTERQRRAVLKKSPDVTSWRVLLEEARAGTTAEQAS